MIARFKALTEDVGAPGVHILGGINDIAGNGGAVPLAETRANLVTICEIALGRNMSVWLASVLPVTHIWWAPAVRDAAGQVVELNLALQDAARGLGVRYLDYHGRLADRDGRLQPAFGTDGVHLSPAGYAAITPIALAGLGLEQTANRADGLRERRP